MGKSLFDFIAPIAGAALGSVIPGVGTAIGAAVGSGLNSGVKTGNPLAGVLSAGGSYLGGQALGGAGGILGDTVGSTVGSTAANFIGPQLASTTLGSVAGSALGSSIGESAGEAMNPPKMGFTGAMGPPGFSPSKQPEMGLPQSLSQFGGLSPQQQGSNIATKGVYGGGNGPQETNYFLNLMNRQLFDNGGNVANDNSSINPVEMGYLNQLGISGSTPTDLLKGISQYGT